MKKDKCNCKKSKKSNLQCPNKKLPNLLFCGVHKKCYKTTGLFISSVNIKIIEKKNHKDKDKVNFNKFKIKFLKKLCQKYNIIFGYFDKKKDIINKLNIFKQNISKIYNSKNIIRRVIKLQSLFRGKYIRDRFGELIISNCVNITDIDGTEFILNDKINNISYNDIFIFSNKNIKYCFRITTFKKIIAEYGKNPYTCTNFSEKILNNFQKRLKYIKDNNIYINENIFSHYYCIISYQA